jgi:hypothetical protein
VTPGEGAHEKGEPHEHIPNRVVVYLNDQPGAKADDVRIALRRKDGK